MDAFLTLVQKNPFIKLRNTCLVGPRLVHKRHVLNSYSYGFKNRAVRTANLLPTADAHLSLEVNTEKRGSMTDSVLEDLSWPSPNDEIPFWKKDFPSWDMNQEVPVNIEKDSDLMHIVHITAEMAPIAKVGGLGDVVTGLARACLSRGHTVDIMLPFYECIPKQQINELELMTTYNSYHDGSWVPTNVYRGVVSGIPVILIEPSNHFFKGQFVYGGSYNELEAYLFFSRACLEWMQVTGTQPDIIHVHEWQTGALPLLYWDMYHHLSLKKPRLVLTIHNMEHYGECSKEQLSMCGLDGSGYATIDKAIDDRTIGHNPERLSLLKGGIVYSNSVVYHGILNGIDTAMWNPAKDVFLPSKFHAQEAEGKKICKRYVQRGLGLAPDCSRVSKDEPDSVNRVPLVVCITRLVAQKGLHLITHAIKQVEELNEASRRDVMTSRTMIALERSAFSSTFQRGGRGGGRGSFRGRTAINVGNYIDGLHGGEIAQVDMEGGQMVVLGKASDGRVEREFEGLSNLVILMELYTASFPFPSSLNDLNCFPEIIEMLLTFCEELSHMLYAAADMVLVPSIYEPCGLAQMIGMRYGAIPIVRKTGGLADTVFDMDDQSNSDMANGFVFEGIDEGSFNWALDRACRHFREKPDEWNDIVRKVMEIDNSWNNTAGKYIDVYNSIRARC
ncbi:hypothetical protein HHK36_013422 [Tetracentron sinense]|uniref:starch synthase n=1 Tax=Tetracentron sinense TaxID=13715 RepID=A0A835DEE4_TETSI|nr:hypothetical protein HHK36_013422 [Tetracentron sinense]